MQKIPEFSGQGRSVLIADDDRITRTILTGLLKEFAESGEGSSTEETSR